MKENIEVNPVYYDGIVYFVSADWKLNAVEVISGKLVWSKQFFRPSRRGILFQLDKINNKKSILITSGNSCTNLIARLVIWTKNLVKLDQFLLEKHYLLL